VVYYNPRDARVLFLIRTLRMVVLIQGDTLSSYQKEFPPLPFSDYLFSISLLLQDVIWSIFGLIY
jgi:hypothetical protein